MAKSLKQQQAQTGKEFDELAKIQAEWDKILEKKRKGQKYDEERLKFLKKEYKSYSELEKKVNGLSDQFNTLYDTIEDYNKELGKSIENFEDVEESIKSIGFGISKNDKLYDAFSSKIDNAKSTLKSVSAILQKQGTSLSQNQIDNANEAAESYKRVFTSVGDASKELKRGNITQTEFNEIVQDSYKEFSNLIDNIDDSTEAGKALKQTLSDAYKEVESFNKAAEKSAKTMGMLDTAVDQLGSSGIPLVGELGKAFQKLAERDVKGAKMAITALGAAMGALAGKYFGAEFDAARVAANDVKQTEIERAKEVGKIRSEAEFIPQKIQLEKDRSAIESANEINKLNIDASKAAEKAANSFSASMKMAAAQFNAASKTALFGNKLGSVGYGAAQLQTAGIGAEKIAGAMSAASAATGKMPTGKMGADMAIMAERTGQSVESIASINEMFQRMDGMSAQTAMNMQEGMRAMADNAGISLSNLMTEVAEASKEALGYQIKSGPALAKQVAYAQSMGVSFGDVAKAGKNMVLNYKDSIKAEMQLSSLLGEQVDLSEVRAKFAAGDQAGALEAIKAQGLDPAQMDQFQQDALQQALGGMDLQSLSKIAQNTGAQVGALQGGQAGKENQSFLTRAVGAQAGLEAAQARISADQAIVDATLAEKINQAYLGSKGYLEYQKALSNNAEVQANLNAEIESAFQKTPAYITALADSTKLQIERTFTENNATVIGGLIGGAVSSFLANKLGGGGGIMDMLSGKAGDSIFDKLLGKNTPPGSTTTGLGSKAAQFGSKAGPIAAAAAGIWSIFKGSYNVADSEALNKGKGGKGQTVGNVVAGIGAEFVNVLDKVTFGATKSLAEMAGVSIKGVDTSKMEQARAAYRQQTGQQIGLGEEGNQKLINWLMANKEYLSGKGGLQSTVQAFEKSLAEGKIKVTSTAAAVPAVAAKTAAGKTAAATSVAATPGAATAAKPAAPTSVAPPVLANADKILEKIQKEADTRGIILAQKIENVFRKMTEVNGNLQKTVDRTHKSATSLGIIDTTTKAMLQVNKNIQNLIGVLANENVTNKLIIDGRAVASMLQRRAANEVAQKIPPGPGGG